MTEKLIKDIGNSDTYYSTAIDIDNGFYTIDVIEDNDVKYSDEIRIIDGATTYFYGDLGDSRETTKIKNKLRKDPFIMFNYKEITVALNGSLFQTASVFHQDYPQYNIFYEWSYEGDVIAWGSSIPLLWDLETSEITPKKGKNVLTFSIKIGNIWESKTIAKKDFYFEVTDAVTENSLSDAVNALPNKYDLGNLSSYTFNKDVIFQLENTKVLLSDNTSVIFNTKDTESVFLRKSKAIKNKTITNDYNLIRGNVEITHNNKTDYYVIDKNEFNSYISFEIDYSNERVCATKIKGNNILKNGVDISDNQAELEQLASYFVALLYDENKTGVTYIDDNTIWNRSTSKYLFENYKSGPYSIDGSVEVVKNSVNVNEDPSSIFIKTELTLKEGNNKIALTFESNYNIFNKQYSDFEIKNLNINGRKFSKDELSEDIIEKIKSFVDFQIQ